ncbi:MAG: uL15 family ribosomal protein [Minisyncoccia bacterium]
MQIHELKTKYPNRKKKRVGRGGKRGTTAGKGQKGQKARAGHRIPKAARIQILKFPKLRGVKNKSTQNEIIVIALGQLNALAEGGKLDRKILLKKGMIGRISDRIKVLNNGEIKEAVIIEGIAVSKNAKTKIEKAGGKVL